MLLRGSGVPGREVGDREVRTAEPTPEVVERFREAAAEAAHVRQMAQVASAGLGSMARDRFDGDDEPQEGFATGSTTVSDLRVGTPGPARVPDGGRSICQGGLVSWHAVALVEVGTGADSLAGTDLVTEVRPGVRGVFAPLCTYQQNGCSDPARCGPIAAGPRSWPGARAGAVAELAVLQMISPIPMVGADHRTRPRVCRLARSGRREDLRRWSARGVGWADNFRGNVHAGLVGVEVWAVS